MMDRLKHQRGWRNVSRREWAVFGLAQQLVVLGLLVALWATIATADGGPDAHEVALYAVALATGLQLALLYCRLRKWRGGE